MCIADKLYRKRQIHAGGYYGRCRCVFGKNEGGTPPFVSVTPAPKPSNIHFGSREVEFTASISASRYCVTVRVLNTEYWWRSGRSSLRSLTDNAELCLYEFLY